MGGHPGPVRRLACRHWGDHRIAPYGNGLFQRTGKAIGAESPSTLNAPLIPLAAETANAETYGSQGALEIIPRIAQRFVDTLDEAVAGSTR